MILGTVSRCQQQRMRSVIKVVSQMPCKKCTLQHDGKLFSSHIQRLTHWPNHWPVVSTIHHNLSIISVFAETWCPGTSDFYQTWTPWSMATVQDSCWALPLNCSANWGGAGPLDPRRWAPTPGAGAFDPRLLAGGLDPRRWGRSNPDGCGRWCGMAAQVPWPTTFFLLSVC